MSNTLNVVFATKCSSKKLLQCVQLDDESHNVTSALTKVGVVATQTGAGAHHQVPNSFLLSLKCKETDLSHTYVQISVQLNIES